MGQRIGAAALSAETALGIVEIHDGFGAGDYIRGMGPLVEIMAREVAGGCLEITVAPEADAGAARIFDFDPADIGLVAVFLRQDVGDVFVRDGAFVESNRRGALAITVIFPRAATEPAEFFKTGCELERDAETGKIRQSLVDHDVVFENKPAIWIKGDGLFMKEAVIEAVALGDMNGPKDRCTIIAERDVT